MTLAQLECNSSATIVSVGGQGALRRRLLEMGLIPGTKVTMRKIAPMGDPMELSLRGYTLTMRREEAARVEVKI
ncbi:MAG TPA: FeoA family protein [Terriglobales bacterium]|nr:FeoA family protein [Candidatus Acidoferrum sp.]HWQ51021.1 FeoA family protein [Terriglobales bacterium]